LPATEVCPNGTTIKLVDGYWLPYDEMRLDEVLKDSAALGRPAYQHKKFEAALRYCAGRGLAIDVGSHIGMWSLQMLAAGFKQVFAFDPDPSKHECFHRNVARWAGPRQVDVTHHQFGLSSERTRVNLKVKAGTTLKTHVAAVADGAFEVMPLDSVPLPVGMTCDFLKIDVEGFEQFVVRGAEILIKRDKPVIIVEQKDGVASKRYGLGDHDALDILTDWGYQIAEDHNGDFIMLMDHHVAVD